VQEEQRTEEGDFEVVFMDDCQGNGAEPFKESNKMKRRWGGIVYDFTVVEDLRLWGLSKLSRSFCQLLMI
jgi:hypothetical protein